ncbi:hypothetical protein CAPTEDRAFT_185078, partial [Capitella teleta]
MECEVEEMKNMKMVMGMRIKGAILKEVEVLEVAPGISRSMLFHVTLGLLADLTEIDKMVQVKVEMEDFIEHDEFTSECEFALDSLEWKEEVKKDPCDSSQYECDSTPSKFDTIQCKYDSSQSECESAITHSSQDPYSDTVFEDENEKVENYKMILDEDFSSSSSSEESFVDDDYQPKNFTNNDIHGRRSTRSSGLPAVPETALERKEKQNVKATKKQRTKAQKETYMKKRKE